ncbi:TIGR03936 family radical SAM-associated protein [Acetobacterium sp.]|jgi:radical SAM-linked protein|uniref:TIGR03936 family radical SAM-associated protein n=1 Tax=Acetobacterium sp. TaxID=1872094 RepID=UPI00271699A5|nr:TIGR03936 family radical SAM-associated protein [Acetobacterium sp.]MDO9493841.1 TIGR03936 family radical SAM-associated protein [Acetobacterium sp.]
MVKIQYQFKRSTPLRFLSHLDQQRLFQRAFRRANMPVEYSQGFNPHPRMSFALAMSVGLTSDGEYGEVIVSEDVDVETFISRMNKVLPNGLEIISAKICGEVVGSLSAALSKSIYRIRIKIVQGTDLNELAESLHSYLALPQILMQKRNKKGKYVEKDIRPFIESISVFADPEKDKVNVKMTLVYIEQQCVKPEHVLESINNQNSAVFLIDPTIEIHREKLLINADA